MFQYNPNRKPKQYINKVATLTDIVFAIVYLDRKCTLRIDSTFSVFCHFFLLPKITNTIETICWLNGYNKNDLSLEQWCDNIVKWLPNEERETSAKATNLTIHCRREWTISCGKKKHKATEWNWRHDEIRRQWQFEVEAFNAIWCFFVTACVKCVECTCCDENSSLYIQRCRCSFHSFPLNFEYIRTQNG